MANEIKTIKIAEIKSNDKFINIKDEAGQEYGVSREKSPKLIAILEKSKVGDSVTGEVFIWNTKTYLSDPKENKSTVSGKAFAPKDKPYEAATKAFEAACQAYTADKEKSDEKIIALAQKGYDFIMGKVTKNDASK